MAPLAIFWIIGSLIAGYLGRDSRIGFWGCVLLSFLVSPPVIIVYLVLLHPAKVKD